MSYPVNTMLRYYPVTSSDHYTARIQRDNKVFQVKPQKQSFDSVSTWLQSLPEQPTQADLRIEEDIRTPYDASWKVPTSSVESHYGYRHLISWPAYLYRVIMKYNANLKQNAELKEEFHNLTAVLDKYKDKGIALVDYRNAMTDYREVLITPSEKEPWLSLNVRFYAKYGSYNYNPVHITQRKEFVPQIYEAYKPLYDLMEKHGIIAWIHTYREEQKKKSHAKMEAYAARCNERQAAKKAKQEQKMLQRQLNRLERHLYTVQYKKIRLEYREKDLQAAILKVKEDMAK